MHMLLHWHTGATACLTHACDDRLCPHLLPVQAFAQTLQQSRGFGSEFRFPDRPAGATTPAGEAAAAAATPSFAGAAADDEDDLYS